jgi:hypothetical protein
LRFETLQNIRSSSLPKTRNIKGYITNLNIQTKSTRKLNDSTSEDSNSLKSISEDPKPVSIVKSRNTLAAAKTAMDYRMKNGTIKMYAKKFICNSPPSVKQCKFNIGMTEVSFTAICE